MKAVLISIQPKWCNLIAKGKKTVEVRKTKPKLETPFKCYIYESLGARTIEEPQGRQKVIGEFVCDKIEEMERDVNDWLPKHRYDIAPKLLKATSLTEEELWDYGKSFMLYGWHISELKIYDEPKQLWAIRKIPKSCTTPPTALCSDECDDCFWATMTRPPQSWCYVEELK